MIKSLFFSFLVLITSTALLAQVPTWSDDVASIIYDNCSVCHHSGAVAPFPLMSYDDAQLHAFSIQAVVNARIMPPWPPDPDYNHLANEKVLSDEEIATINGWVDNYMPTGDLSSAPAPPVFYGSAVMEQPSDTVILPHFQIPNNYNQYFTFTIHSNYTEPKYVNQVEFIPSDPSLIHHSIYYQDTSDLSWQADEDYPGPGFPTYTTDMSPYLTNFGGYVPGQGLVKFPSYMGIEILPGADLVIEVHYAPYNIGKIDSSKILLKFTDDPDVRRIYEERYLFSQAPVLVNGPLFIPANTVATFNEKTTLSSAKSMVGLAPHSHLICTSWKVDAVPPSGDTSRLIYIPKWDFGWQYTYLLTKVMAIEPGTQLLGEAVFNNTINNPDNPNNPPVDVDEGQSTFDEMMACRFWVMDYQEGDENIILDSAFYGFPVTAPLSEPEYSVKVFPNPSDQWLSFSLNVSQSELNWSLTNALQQNLDSGFETGITGHYSKVIDVSALPPGMYFLTVRINEKEYKNKVIVSH